MSPTPAKAMNTFLTTVDAWVTALLLATAMLGAWGLGWWRGHRLGQDGRKETTSKLNDASMALLGLLLAFTFSMSLSRHEQRRQMVVADSNAIGDFYTAASFTNQPVRGQLQNAIRQYVDHRLDIVKQRLDEAAMEKKLIETEEMQGRMQDLVGKAVDGGTSVVVPLVNTLNGLTSAHTARLSASHDRLPPSIVLLLFLATIVSMALAGSQEGRSGELHLGATLGFVILVSMAVWVTLDLNQPQRGLIMVSQESMERLRSSLNR
ncbi:MAG: hypothetical protein K2R98_07625 [Gemmataceae bacterium]|nr:hypothetical protein [Gemmataceae bacterium]